MTTTSTDLADVNPETLARVKQSLLEAARTLRSGISMVELVNNAGPEARGDYMLTAPGHPNVVLWTGVSAEFCRAYSELMRDKLLECVPTTALVYFIDGEALDLPLVKSLRAYKTPHWLPVTVKLAERTA